MTDEIDPLNAVITTRLNGEVRQKDSTSLQIINLYELISFISQSMTLKAGDIVTTGTPKGVGPMKPSDIVEIEIEGIGILKNTVVKR